MGLLFAAYLAFAAIWNVSERSRHKKLAGCRPLLSKYEFISSMGDSGVRSETASFVWDEVVSYYHEPLKPDPSDHWESTIGIDPEDLEDITARFWNLNRWIEPTLKNPVTIPGDPSLLEYARWLDDQRQSY